VKIVPKTEQWKFRAEPPLGKRIRAKFKECGLDIPRPKPCDSCHPLRGVPGRGCLGRFLRDGISVPREEEVGEFINLEQAYKLHDELRATTKVAPARRRAEPRRVAGRQDPQFVARSVVSARPGQAVRPLEARICPASAEPRSAPVINSLRGNAPASWTTWR